MTVDLLWPMHIMRSCVLSHCTWHFSARQLDLWTCVKWLELQFSLQCSNAACYASVSKLHIDSMAKQALVCPDAFVSYQNVGTSCLAAFSVVEGGFTPF